MILWMPYVGCCLPTLVSCQHQASIPFSAMKAEIRRAVKSSYKDSLGPLSKRVNLRRMKNDLNRSEQSLAARLRTGQHPKVGKMNWKYLKLREDSLCRCCPLVDETVEHIYNDCMDTVVVSLKTELKFNDRDILYSDPKVGIEFMKKLAAIKKWVL